MAQSASGIVPRVQRVCDRHTTERALRVELAETLRSAAPFEDFAWLLTDPETSVGSAPLADVRCLPQLPTLIRLRYQSAVNRWTALESPAVSLSAATGGDLAQSLVWRELLDGHGVGDIATIVFTDQFGCWGFLDLWRSRGAPSFTAAELALLAECVPPVTRAIRRCQAATFDEQPDLASVPDGPAVLVLSPDLDVVVQTEETARYLDILVPPPTGQSPVPAAAYNVAAQLLAREAGVDDHPPSARVNLRGGIWLTCRAARMREEGPWHRRHIAVTIEKTSASDRVTLFARAFGLTPREEELLLRVVAGADTKQVASAMFLSQLTVQDHLKSIFAKTNARTRLQLMSRAVGA